MTSVLLSACVLAGLTVVVHATGIAFLLRLHLQPRGVWHVTRMLLRMVWWLVLLHLAEISIWGLFYVWRGCLPNAETAFYFSGTTLYPPWLWRLGTAKPVAAARPGRRT